MDGTHELGVGCIVRCVVRCARDRPVGGARAGILAVVRRGRRDHVRDDRAGSPRQHWFAAWARVQWAITLALIPLLLAMFQQISLVSPLANAIAIPVVSLAVVPLTLVGVALPFDLVLHLAHRGHGRVRRYARMDERTAARRLAAACAAAMDGSDRDDGIAWMLLPRGFPGTLDRGGGILPLFLVLPAALAERTVKLTVLDVGQGLAVVVQTRHHALLYDAGPAYGPQIDSGNRIIVPYLRASGVRVLTGMIVTHADNDHSGGANSVVQAMAPQWLLTSMAADHPAIALAASASRCEAGARWQWDGVDFELLHPAPDNYDARKISRQRSQLRAENNGG